MGNKAPDLDEKGLAIATGLPFMEEAQEKLAQEFSLEHPAELEDLLDKLFGYSCRDREAEVQETSLSARRARGYHLAKTMRAEAAKMLESLDIIHGAMTEFNNESVRFHPPLLEAIFTSSTGGPQELYLPDDLQILEGFFPESIEGESGELPAVWDIAAARLTMLAALPIQPKLPTSTMPDMTLQKAVYACKTYWREVEGRTWSMSLLKNPVTRRENRIDLLMGPCERFVAMALNAIDYEFNLSELRNAWASVDKHEARKSRGATA